MAKRFIDTNIFADEWFMELSKDAKLLWIYFITNCDHAGILKLNKKLCEFQTGIKGLETVIEQLGNSIVTVSEGLEYFIPKFIKFQYPGFPESRAPQQKSAIQILISKGLYDNSSGTLIEQLPNCYGNGNGNGNGNKKEKRVVKGKKETETPVDLPWDTESFRKAWEEWKEYRRQEHGFKYKTATSQSGALSELFSLSMGNETNAIEIMRQSEANGWKGFFKLKDKNDGKTATRSGRVVRGTDYDDLKPGEIPISDIGRRSDP